MERLELIIGEVLDRGKFVFRPLHREDEFGQFKLDRQCIAVLGVLDQEYHQKGDDRRAGIDDELPCVAIAKERPGRDPGDDHQDRQQKCHRISRPQRGRVRELGKPLRQK